MDIFHKNNAPRSLVVGFKSYKQLEEVLEG